MKPILLPILLTAALAACSSTSSTTPTAKPVAKAATTLKIQSAAPVAPAPFMAAALTLADGVTVTSAVIVVKEVNIKGWEGFEEGEDGEDSESESDETASTAPAFATASETAEVEDDEDSVDAEDAVLEADEVDFSGPFVIDLLTGVSTPSLAQAKLPVGNYSQVEFKLDSIESEGEDGAEQAFAAGMTGASVSIGGQITIDGVTHNFMLLDYRDEELKWSFALPVNITAAQVNSLVLNIPVDGWVNAAMVQGMIDAYHAGVVTAPTGGTLVYSTDVGDIADLLDKNITSEGEVEHEDDSH